MDVKKVIAAFGGIRPTATELDIAVSTVQGWVDRNRIPENRIPEIEAVLKVYLELKKTASKQKTKPKARSNKFAASKYKLSPTNVSFDEEDDEKFGLKDIQSQRKQAGKKTTTANVSALDSKSSVDDKVVKIVSSKGAYEKSLDIKPTKHSIKPNEHNIKPNEDNVKPNEHSIKPNEDSVKPNEHSIKPNELPTKPRGAGIFSKKIRKTEVINVVESGADMNPAPLTTTTKKIKGGVVGGDNPLLVFAVILSMLSGASVITEPLWRPYVTFSFSENVKTLGGDSFVNKDNFKKVISILKETIDLTLEENAKLLDKVQNSIDSQEQLRNTQLRTDSRVASIEKEVNSILDTIDTDVRILLLNRLLSITLIGEPFDSFITQLKVNADETDLYRTLVENSNGIKTKTFLIKTLKINSRALSSKMTLEKATGFFEQVIARVKSLVYVSNKEDLINPDKQKSHLNKLLYLVIQDDWSDAIEFARSYDLEFLNRWADMAQARYETISAIEVLLGNSK